MLRASIINELFEPSACECGRLLFESIRTEANKKDFIKKINENLDARENVHAFAVFNISKGGG